MKHLTYTIAALMAVGCFGVLGCKKDDTKQAANDVGDAAKKAKDAVVAGVTPSGSSKIEDTRSTLEGVVEKVAKRNDWNDMADHFTKADAARVKAGKPETKDLDDLAETFGKAWKAKYSDEFSVMKADTVFAPDFFTITEDSTSTKEMKKAQGAIKESHGMPGIKMMFVSEDGKWRLDLADDIDSAKLFGNLKTALTELQDTTKLPADKNDAYRHVSHRVLMAVTNTAPGGGPAASAE